MECFIENLLVHQQDSLKDEKKHKGKLLKTKIVLRES